MTISVEIVTPSDKSAIVIVHGGGTTGRVRVPPKSREMVYVYADRRLEIIEDEPQDSEAIA